jgi:hypothetical protein
VGVLSVQLGSSRRAWLLFAAYAIMAIVFEWIGLTQRDGVAAALCLASLVGAARMGFVLRIRSETGCTWR